MRANAIKNIVTSGSVLGAVALVAACASSESEPAGTSGNAGSTGKGGTGSGGSATAGRSSGAGSGGTAGSSSAGTPGSAGSGTAGRSSVAGSGGTAGSSSAGTGGIAGSGCTYSDIELLAGAPATDAGGADGAGGAGGADGAGVGDFECIPGNIYACFTPPVAAPGLPFVTGAWAFGAEELVVTAEVRSPERGTVCMSGTYPGGGILWLALAGGAAPFTSLAANLPGPSPAQLFHARSLGITDVSFKVEPPPGIAVGFSMAAASTCSDAPVYGAPDNDGNPFIIAASGTTRVSLADFVSLEPPLPFDTNAIYHLQFAVGSGPYDFCVSDLKFLDANGDEVTP